MKVLVNCEFSGIVRDAFAAKGHEAWSCDLLPTERPGNHIEGDAIDALTFLSWDLMIAHPPCTFLTNSGVRWLYKDGNRQNGVDEERWEEMEKAREFFLTLYNAPIPRVCVENPLPHPHARLQRFTQTIQPWQFGHGEVKATCLWLRGLRPLRSTNRVAGRTPRVHFASPGPDRWKERSRTLSGIADAMAEQWGSI